MSESSNIGMGVYFVFGSNEMGVHGKGSALVAAKMYGARRGVGEGLSGRSYAIPTKKTPRVFMTLGEVRRGVERFKKYAEENPDKEFFLTKIGCGNAGFTEEQIKPMFEHCPPNVQKPEGW